MSPFEKVILSADTTKGLALSQVVWAREPHSLKILLMMTKDTASMATCSASSQILLAQELHPSKTLLKVEMHIAGINRAAISQVLLAQ